MTIQAVKCYRRITSCILAAGWSAAGGIYLTAGSVAENPFEEFEHSKRFQNSVERMGGKTALIANDLNAWFLSLWQGERLAGTIAIITIVAAACYYFIASNMAADRSHQSH